MKTFEQFKLELNEVRGLSKLVTSMRVGPAIKHLRTPFNKPVRMYHGTLKTASNQIMNKGFTPTQTVNPKTLSTEYSNVYLTTNPKRAEYYANLAARNQRGKPDIIAVNVNKTRNMRKGVRGDEFVVPVKDTIPTATGVRPIKRKKGEIIQDNYQVIMKTFKQFQEQVVPKNSSEKSPYPNSYSGALPYVRTKDVLERGAIDFFSKYFMGPDFKQVKRKVKTKIKST